MEAIKMLDDRYQILERVGGGGMAEVYKAKDTILNRIVAIKILRSQLANDSDFVNNFHREAQRAAGLSHPNIVGIYDVGETQGLHYIVMEYVSSETLKKKLKAAGRLPVGEALSITKDIARALAYAHANNIIHCDIKPHNILITPDGRVKVADFGIARAVTSSTMTYSGDIVGSVHYFSPEQAKGVNLTPKTDVYSLGVVLYELLTGEVPFTGETSVSIALKHIDVEASSVRDIVPEIPAVVEAVAMKALTKDVERRPDSSELIALINKAEDVLYDNGDDDDDATRVISRIDPVDYDDGDDDEQTDYDERPLWKRVLIVIAVLLVLGSSFLTGLYFILGKFWAVAEVDVPRVVGLNVEQAKKILLDKNLKVSVKEVYDVKPAGEVIFQSPEPEQRVKEERTVSISVSKGGEMVEMPDIVGKSRRDAQTQLHQVGLVVGNIYEKISEGEPGNVLEQNPPPTTKLARGAKIDFTVSKRKVKRVPVPTLVNQPASEAETVLSSNGLKLGKVTEKESQNKPGIVISQNPAGGREADEGTEIDIIISIAAKPAEKPKKEEKPAPAPKPAAPSPSIGATEGKKN